MQSWPSSMSSSSTSSVFVNRAVEETKHLRTNIIPLQVEVDEDINASGHRDQLKRQYGLLHTIEVALVLDDAWLFFGSSLALAINNGGPPGVIYELMVACLYYSFIAASLAELASAIPSSGGMYHYASITPGPKYGRVVGYFTGALNVFGWLITPAAIGNTMGVLVLQLYKVYHDDYQNEPWHLFVIATVLIWANVAFCVFANRWMPTMQRVGCFVLIAGFFVTVVVLAAMPKQHASNSFVWTNWDNRTGWPGAVAFFVGVLNGAITIGTPESITHVAEELPNPTRDLPLGILAQMSIGTVTSFIFAVAICYGITDLDGLLETASLFPLTEIYLQATGSRAAAFGLTMIVFLALEPCMAGSTMAIGRNWWALSRDRATPFWRVFSIVDEERSCPVWATLFAGAVATALSAISLGSSTAQADLMGSGIVIVSISIGIPIAGNLFTGRKHVPKGWFHMGKYGFAVNAIALFSIVFFAIWFCFPATLPVAAETMNYNSVIVTGFIAIAVFWWFAYAKNNYPGAAAAKLYLDM